MFKEVKIPEDRVRVLIGKNHDVIKEIEKLGVKLRVNKNNVLISGDDGINVMTTENIVKAIGRGFSPDKALLLKDEKMCLVIIDLNEYLTDKGLKRQKARIIGEKGKVREKLEELTETFISVYGKTVSVIGDYKKVSIAKKSIEKLISGASHRSVYDFLERAL